MERYRRGALPGCANLLSGSLAARREELEVKGSHWFTHTVAVPSAKSLLLQIRTTRLHLVCVIVIMRGSWEHSWSQSVVNVKRSPVCQIFRPSHRSTVTSLDYFDWLRKYTAAAGLERRQLKATHNFDLVIGTFDSLLEPVEYSQSVFRKEAVHVFCMGLFFFCSMITCECCCLRAAYIIISGGLHIGAIFLFQRIDFAEEYPSYWCWYTCTSSN